MGRSLSMNPKTRIEFEAREKALKDKTSSLNYARAEGRAEGKAEGKAEGRAEGKAEAEAKAEKDKLDSVKSMLSILDDQTIANIMKLDISEVRKIREEWV